MNNVSAFLVDHYRVLLRVLSCNDNKLKFDSTFFASNVLQSITRKNKLNKIYGEFIVLLSSVISERIHRVLAFSLLHVVFDAWHSVAVDARRTKEYFEVRCLS